MPIDELTWFPSPTNVPIIFFWKNVDITTLKGCFIWAHIENKHMHALRKLILFLCTESEVAFELNCVKSVQIRSYFWSVFSCIRIEYGDLLRTSPYSIRIHENMDQKQLRIWTVFTQCKCFYSGFSPASMLW